MIIRDQLLATELENLYPATFEHFKKQLIVVENKMSVEMKDFAIKTIFKSIITRKKKVDLERVTKAMEKRYGGQWSSFISDSRTNDFMLSCQQCHFIRIKIKSHELVLFEPFLMTA